MVLLGEVERWVAVDEADDCWRRWRPRDGGGARQSLGLTMSSGSVGGRDTIVVTVPGGEVSSWLKTNFFDTVSVLP